jgi:hypothetical protein
MPPKIVSAYAHILWRDSHIVKYTSFEFLNLLIKRLFLCGHTYPHNYPFLVATKIFYQVPHYVDHAILELRIFLPQPPEYWYYMHVLPYPALSGTIIFFCSRFCRFAKAGLKLLGCSYPPASNS